MYSDGIIMIIIDSDKIRHKNWREKMKRAIAIFLILLMVFTFVSCTQKPSETQTPQQGEQNGTPKQEALFKPGTYKASEYGNNDYIEVEVTVDENKILSVNVTNHAETKFIGDKAIEVITKQVVDYQTLSVDSISGATVTSAALKKAISDCIEHAGADTSLLNAKVPAAGEKKSEVTKIDADVIIIGAGGAGLSAAATVAEKGDKVIVIEKMPLIGGNTARCASAYNTSDLDRQSALPMTDTLKEAVEKALGTTPVNDDHKQLIADVKEKYDDYLNSGSTTLFDCPEWHALQTYLGVCQGDVCQGDVCQGDGVVVIFLNIN